MQLYANNVASVLAGAVSAGSTSLTLASGTGAKFPNPSGGNYFVITLYQMAGGIEINHEIVRCTGRAGDVLTVVRAQEGTTARAFNVSDPLSMRLTAGGLTPAALGAMDATASVGSLTLLAAITPTAVAAINVLNIFNATMDNYMVVINGVGCSTAGNDTLQMRLAVAGVADAGANYVTALSDGSSKSTTATALDLFPCGAPPAVGSLNLTLFNLNAGTTKSIEHRAVFSTQAGYFAFNHRGHVFVSANPVTGFSLFWAGGSNFTAGGMIRIYGLKNT